MSIYKRFRAAPMKEAGANTLSSRFDQPTYMTFKLVFGYQRDIWYNGSGLGTNYVVNYDRMPHPLFGIEGSDAIESRESYSAIDYLRDANEHTRAEMLKEFIQKFNTLQNDFQWYFQKIDGVGDLLKIDPKKGIRIPQDKRLTVTTLEGIDLRMSHLMNLYRKIVWDDTYQRWVLPDMMRYFTLKIYIAEFRTFHTPNQYDGWGNALGINKFPGELNLKILDNLIPTWVINCEMCEFDIENINFGYLDSLGVGEDPTEAGVSFGIKVGKIHEEQIYPVFRNMYLFDKVLNGFNRSKSSDIDLDDWDSTLADSGTNLGDYRTKIAIAQNQEGIIEKDHISGRPFNEMTNSDSLFGIPGRSDIYLRALYGDDWKKVAPSSTDSNTWIDNAFDFGKAFGINLGKKVIDKAKLTPIPGLGVSFNEVEAALESKNIITALGIIRKGVNSVTAEYVQPSELLDGKIVDGIFKTYLKGVVASQATEGNKLLQFAANIALNDDGTWTKIKDYSLATDLVSQGEINSPNPIKGGSNLRDAILESTQGDLSGATNLVGTGETNVPRTIQINAILEDVPSSQATSNKIVKG